MSLRGKLSKAMGGGRMTALWLVGAAMLGLCACEGINCTLNNVVLCHYTFYDSQSGRQISLSDTLTITAYGTDSILYNSGVNASSVSLPMSYYADCDTLLFYIWGDSVVYPTITLYVSKENTVHYESPDCPSTMFHHITGVSSPSLLVDTVSIIRADVDYLQDENIRVYFRTADD